MQPTTTETIPQTEPSLTIAKPSNNILNGQIIIADTIKNIINARINFSIFIILTVYYLLFILQRYTFILERKNYQQYFTCSSCVLDVWLNDFIELSETLNIIVVVSVTTVHGVLLGHAYFLNLSTAVYSQTSSRPFNSM